MKKYKVSFSIFNLFSESSAEVVKLQTIIKGLTATIGGSALITGNEVYLLGIGIVGFALDAIAACFYFEEKK